MVERPSYTRLSTRLVRGAGSNPAGATNLRDCNTCTLTPS